MKDPKALEVKELLELVIVEPESNQDKQQKEDERFIIEKQLRNFTICWELKNLQPLESIANIKKGNK